MTIAAVTAHYAQKNKDLLSSLQRELDGQRGLLGDLVREQLYSGRTGNTELTPSYLQDPYFKSPRQAEAYRDWKLRITPPVPSERLQLPARDPDTPNLFITGMFHSHIEVQPIVAGERIGGGSDQLSKDVTDKYGDRLYQLGDEAKKYIKDNIFTPFLRAYFS